VHAGETTRGKGLTHRRVWQGEPGVKKKTFEDPAEKKAALAEVHRHLTGADGTRRTSGRARMAEAPVRRGAARLLETRPWGTRGGRE
jgi:hypothetical protein